MMFLIGVVAILYIVISGLPVYKILTKYNQTNAWLAFVPIVSTYKFSKFSHEGVFNGDSKNEFGRMMTGLILTIVSIASVVFTKLAGLLSENADFDILAVKTVSLSVVKDAFVNGEFVIGLLVLATIVAKGLAMYGLLNSSLYNGFSMNRNVMVIIAVASVVSSAGLFGILYLVFKYMVAFMNAFSPKYDYENYASTARVVYQK